MAQENRRSSRRKFIRSLGGSAMLLAANPIASLASENSGNIQLLPGNREYAANDKIRIAVIGMGIMGHNNVNTALRVPGVELAGVCDLYKGRLVRARELFGNDLYITDDYREVLEKKDIDAVIIATSDNWHARIATDALAKGKAVYLEKPMIHRISEGLPLVRAQQTSGKVMQVGSQRVSSVVYAKAAELYRNGEIGKLNLIEASFDRQSALGAWQYTMPLDHGPDTVSWERYIAGMRKIPYDAKKFFWWRNYSEYGTGVAGDLFVHLLSGVHVITGSKGPEKIYSSGQLSHWKDGRDVPDVMTAIMQYPETTEHPTFQLSLKVNFISGGGDTHSIRFIGEEGVMEIRGNSLLVKHSLMSKAPGIGGWDSLMTYPKAMQETLLQEYNKKYTAEDRKVPQKEDVTYKAPAGFNEHLEHFTNFFEGVRNGTPVIEGAEFGFRAAAPCLACNDSYFQKKIIHWDPVSMKLKEPKK